MARGTLTFKQTDLIRAVKALQSQGLEIVRTDISPDGRFSIFHRLDTVTANTDDETYEEWKARTGASAS